MSSGIIDIRSLVDAARDHASPPPPTPPGLVTPWPRAVPLPLPDEPPRAAPRVVLWAIVGLLGTLVMMLGLLALG